jgi:hypothetical protein
MPGTLRPLRPRVGLLALSALFAALLVLPGSALAGPANPSSPTPVRWAFAGEVSVDRVVTVSGVLGGSYTLHASFATAAILSQWNTSSSGFTVEMNRTLSFVLFANLCSAPCSAGGPSVNLSIRAWEVDQLTANVTRDGTVYLQNGSSLPAFALLSSDSLLVQDLTEQLSWNVASGAGSIDRSAHSRLQVSVDLGPGGLGLFPLTPPTNGTWNSSTPGTVSGTYRVGCTVIAMSGSSPCGPGAGPLYYTGDFAVSGVDVGKTGQSDNGAPTQGMNLTLTSPGTFVLEDGFLLVPTVADLFDAAIAASSAAPFQQVSAEDLGWLTQAPHLGVVASTTIFAPHLPGTTRSQPGTAVPLGTSQPQQSPLGAYSVYGAPVSPAEAHNQSCQEASGCIGPPGGSGTGGAPGTPSIGAGWPLSLSLVAVLAAGLLIAVVMVLRSRSRSPPPTTRVGETLPPPPPSPPGEEDPLGRLW